MGRSMLVRNVAWTAVAGILLCARSDGATPAYDYNAGGDPPGDATWANGAPATVARDLTFVPNAATTPVDVTSPGTNFTKAYEFGSGVTGATTASFGSSDITTAAAAFEMWVKPATLTGKQVLFETGGTTHGAALVLDDNTLTLSVRNTSASFLASHALATTPPSDFIQVVGVVDTVNSQTQLFVNGQFRHAVAGTKNWTAGTDAAGIATQGGSVETGGFPAGSGYGNFSGQIARVRLYGGQHTAQQVYNSFRQLSTTTDPWADRVIADAPGGYWRLDEPSTAGFAMNMGSGTAAGGIGTYSAGGITYGVPGLVNSGGNTAVRFDGATGIITAPASADINSGAAYTHKTIEAFFNADTIPGTGSQAVIYEQGGTSNGFNIFLADGKLSAGSWKNSPDQFNFLDSHNMTVGTGTTYHVVLTHDAARDRVMGFVNGALFDAKAGTADIAAINSHTGVIGIGGTNTDTRFSNTVTATGTGNFFAGTIDEVASYDAAHSFAKVQANYQASGGDLKITPGATLGVALNYDAANSTSDTSWPSSVATVARGGTPNDFSWVMTNATRVTTSVSSFRGITAAYQFSGTGSGGGASGASGDGLDGAEMLVGNLDVRNASFEAWIKPSTLTGNRVIFETGGATTGSSLRLVDDTFELLTRQSTSPALSASLTVDLDADNNGSADNTDFIQIVAVLDVENDLVRLYKDGALVGSTAYTGDDWSGNDAMGLAKVTGATGGGGTFNPFQGQIAIFRYYPDALSDSDVFANYFAVTGVPEPGALAILVAGPALLALRRRRAA